MCIERERERDVICITVNFAHIACTVRVRMWFLVYCLLLTSQGARTNGVRTNGVVTEVPRFSIINFHGTMYDICGIMCTRKYHMANCAGFVALL